jgi:hypothetical protein
LKLRYVIAIAACLASVALAAVTLWRFADVRISIEHGTRPEARATTTVSAVSRPSPAQNWTALDAEVYVAESPWGQSEGISNAECEGLGTGTLNPSGEPKFGTFQCRVFMDSYPRGTIWIRPVAGDAFRIVKSTLYSS